MTKKAKFALWLSTSFLAAVGIFTAIFIFILSKDPLSGATETVESTAIQSSYGLLSSGDLLSLVFVLIFIAIFIYFIFKA